jgi:hydroxymethylpyrimidine kinase/phosphomethylpyrimidine kinase
LAGIEVSDISTMEEAARRIGDMGPRHVLLKGGHLEGESTDLLWSNGQIHRFPGSRIDTLHTHGTGCVLSAAITARLARGESLLSAVEGAKKFVHKAIATHPGLGGGHGPINMFADV